MKKNRLIILILAFALAIVSCQKEKTPTLPAEPKVSYIINYGSYSGDKSTVTSYDKESGKANNGIYESVNGVAMVSNVQRAYSFGKNIYFLGNSSDQIFWVDGETFEQTENAISEDIVKPRFAVGNGNYLYVSCWGGDIWTDISLSYIAKINLTTKKVEKKIPMEGGPEGLIIKHNKLYAALNYKKGVAVLDLETEDISIIETPAVTSYFVPGNRDNLYVSLVSTFADPSEDAGIGLINTLTNTLENTYKLEGISSSYINIMAANANSSKIYTIATEYDANWNLSGSIAVFDMASGKFEETKIVENVAGINGVAYYDNKIFCFIAESVTGNGTAKIFKPDGTFINEFETGIAPYMLLTVE